MFISGEQVKITIGDHAGEIGTIADSERDGDIRIYTISLPNGEATLKTFSEFTPAR